MSISQKDVIYFILTDRFFGKPNPAISDLNRKDPLAWHGGNFEGIIEKIPYLKKLGITALWITPVYWQVPRASGTSQGYHGYWALDFNRVDPHLYADKGYEPGSRKYLRDLVDELHRNDIKLVLDVVVNHAGYDHPGHLGQGENPTPIRPEWFNTNGLSSNDNLIKGELSGLPDFDLDNPNAIDYHIQSLLSWIRETGIDAIRMDTAKHIERGFWSYFKTQLRGLYPDVSLIGEVLVFDIDDLTNYQKNWGFDSLFDFPVQRAIQQVFIGGETLCLFHSPFNNGSGIFERDFAYSNQNRLVSLLDNHDLECRFMTAALQSCNKDYEMATKIVFLALTFIFTTRGIPQIYYGTEIGLEGGADPDNRRDFPWNLIDDKQEVRGAYPHQKAIFDHTCKLIKLRKSSPALYAGFNVCLFADHFVLANLYYVDNCVAITVIHNGWDSMPSSLKISTAIHPSLPERIRQLVNNKDYTCELTGKKISIREGVFEVQMEGKSAFLFLINEPAS
jgi:glycosidase